MANPGMSTCPWCSQPLTARIGASKLTRTRNECRPCLVLWFKHVDTRIGGVTQWKWRVLGFIWDGTADQRPEPWMLEKAHEYVTNKRAWQQSQKAAT